MVDISKIDSKLEKIPTKYIHVDIENPRYREKLILRGKQKWNEKELEEIIQEDIKDILPSIRKAGVIDPIWVHKKKKNYYQIIEGSRRFVALKKLNSESNLITSNDISFDTVQAHVFLKNISKRDINIRKIILQTGKESWRPFNVAAAVYDLVKKDKFTIEDIGIHWKKKPGWVSKTITNFELYLEFTKWNKQNNLISEDNAPQKYTMFQEAGKNIRDVFFQTDKDKKKFYKLITPNEKNITKVSSVVGNNGLRTLNKIIKDENIQAEITGNPNTTIKMAVKQWKENDLSNKWPWVKCIDTLVTGMTKLKTTEMNQIKKTKIVNQIEELIDVAKSIL